jgi:hypothetical protein
LAIDSPAMCTVIFIIAQTRPDTIPLGTNGRQKCSHSNAIRRSSSSRRHRATRRVSGIATSQAAENSKWPSLRDPITFAELNYATQINQQSPLALSDRIGGAARTTVSYLNCAGRCEAPKR